MQVANELKITGYTPKMAILGGRKHYCINETVREAGSNLDEACKDQCASKGGCKVYKKEKIPFLAAKAPAVRPYFARKIPARCLLCAPPVASPCRTLCTSHISAHLYHITCLI